MFDVFVCAAAETDVLALMGRRLSKVEPVMLSKGTGGTNCWADERRVLARGYIIMHWSHEEGCESDGREGQRLVVPHDDR